MPTGTKVRRTSPATGRGRFPRPSSAPRRSGPVQGLRRRRQPEPSGIEKITGRLLPAAQKATPSSKKGKAGGFALLAAAAGMAFKNRDKLARSKRSDGSAPEADGTR